jgi:hypothetical protein
MSQELPHAVWQLRAYPAFTLTAVGIWPSIGQAGPAAIRSLGEFPPYEHLPVPVTDVLTGSPAREGRA